MPYLDVLFDTNSKFTWKLSDNLHFQQTYYAEIWRTLLPNRPTTTRPLETVLRSKGNDPHIGTQIRWTMSNSAVLTAIYSRGLQRAWRESFTGDITTPRRQDTSTGVWSGPWLWHQQFPVRDQINVKVNQYLSGASVTQNLGYGVQIFQEKSHRADIATGGIVFFDFEGQPDEAELRPVDYRASRTRSQGFWVEDELTFGNRVTVKVGARYDHMVGFSQDIDEVDLEFEPTGNTIAGLGHMVTWNAVSPRGGREREVDGRRQDGSASERGSLLPAALHEPVGIAASRSGDEHPLGVESGDAGLRYPAPGGVTGLRSRD